MQAYLASGFYNESSTCLLSSGGLVITVFRVSLWTIRNMISRNILNTRV